MENKTGANLFCLMLYLDNHINESKKEVAEGLGIAPATLQIKLNQITERNFPLFD
jgi:hypothetical protein